MSSEWQNGFLDRLQQHTKWDSWTLYKMNYEITKMQLIPDFTELQAPKYLPQLQPLAHQVEAAETVINRMNGKAILADEVGLGKTIEAGLILKEYLLRGLVKRALILAPASLINQWIEELTMKFHIPATAYKKNVQIERHDVLIMSMDTAKKSPHRERIYAQDYDIIIIDEAHRLKNHKTQVYDFVQGLKKKFCLLLTATPIQNDILEIFYLISLLKPGHLGNYEAFQATFSTNEHADFLKDLVNQVMVRNRRDDTGIEWTSRRVQIVPVQFTEAEREVYDMLSTLEITEPFLRMTLQKEMCSSKEATALTLTKMLDAGVQVEALLNKVMALDVNAKAEKAVEIIEQAKDKVILFTEYRASQLYLQWYLHTKGITSVLFNGKFNKSKRDYMKQLFRDRAQVLIATEAGGEGINLQFCHHVINYDLPWNPMKLEQRIGRVHRLGQEHDVHIYNLAIVNTIEERILERLHTKIDVFEQVIGDLDAILTNLKGAGNHAFTANSSVFTSILSGE
ncbi:putative ATP-dependent helicase YqhH [Lysinibacillus piscis]|uniref:ATP-dependent helicase YqhH n=2 Tax=Lysinibacillus piscis TaxID=2518931 RepID=A0ABQ5NIA9_9BACI|nr:putative ATP-dependent helicase YqhH [Lysinibacillus sp. KH24]